MLLVAEFSGRILRDLSEKMAAVTTDQRKRGGGVSISSHNAVRSILISNQTHCSAWNFLAKLLIAFVCCFCCHHGDRAFFCGSVILRVILHRVKNRRDDTKKVTIMEDVMCSTSSGQPVLWLSVTVLLFICLTVVEKKKLRFVGVASL